MSRRGCAIADDRRRRFAILNTCSRGVRAPRPPGFHAQSAASRVVAPIRRIVCRGPRRSLPRAMSALPGPNKPTLPPHDNFWKETRSRRDPGLRQDRDRNDPDDDHQRSKSESRPAHRHVLTLLIGSVLGSSFHVKSDRAHGIHASPLRLRISRGVQSWIKRLHFMASLRWYSARSAASVASCRDLVEAVAAARAVLWISRTVSNTCLSSSANPRI